MGGIVQLVGPTHAVQLFGVRLVGINAVNLKKLIFTVVFLGFMYLLEKLAKLIVARIIAHTQGERTAFWSRQGIRLVTAVVMLLGIVSIWFDDPARLATAAGLVTAGLAFALQKVVTAVAGYFVILRGRTFNVGDRITMGGVRGDVINVNFIQTTIMEMGEPPGEQDAPPAMWVWARQYTGRLVTVTNDKIFDEPVYNYSREFPYIWDEMRIPIAYDADRQAAERILLEVAERHTVKIADMSEHALKEMQRRYFMKAEELKPTVYWRLTDNWIELSVRFITRDYGVRRLKDQMSRDIMEKFDAAGIGIASGTYQVVGMPPLKVQIEPAPAQNGSPAQAREMADSLKV